MMGAAKPTLGYPSRTAAVLALRTQGCTTGEIARAIGIPISSVLALETSHERQKAKGVEPPLSHRIVLEKELFNKMLPIAAHRGICVGELARRIVAVTIEDGMVDAVLDDDSYLDNPA